MTYSFWIGSSTLNGVNWLTVIPFKLDLNFSFLMFPSEIKKEEEKVTDVKFRMSYLLKSRTIDLVLVDKNDISIWQFRVLSDLPLFELHISIGETHNLEAIHRAVQYKNLLLLKNQQAASVLCLFFSPPFI